MNSTAARNKLLTDPRSFLKYYPVKCAGASAPVQNAANLVQYYLNKQGAGQYLGPGQVLGHRGATRPGLFGYERAISSFKLAPQNSVGAALINQAHVVPMVNHDSD